MSIWDKRRWGIKINKVRQYNEVSERKKVGQWRYLVVQKVIKLKGSAVSER